MKFYMNIDQIKKLIQFWLSKNDMLIVNKYDNMWLWICVSQIAYGSKKVYKDNRKLRFFFNNLVNCKITNNNNYSNYILSIVYYKNIFIIFYSNWNI